jgi:hypothetical protein
MIAVSPGASSVSVSFSCSALPLSYIPNPPCTFKYTLFSVGIQRGEQSPTLDVMQKVVYHLCAADIFLPV